VAPAAINVPPVQWAGIAVFVALAVVASMNIAAIWRGEVESLAEPTRRNRSLVAWFVAAWMMIVALPSVLYVTSRTGPVSPWAAKLLLLALTAVVVSFIVASLVWLTGHPKTFVPPRMRSDRPGA
jgi:hypothetical protein